MMRHLPSGSLVSPPDSGELDQSLDVELFMKTAVTMGLLNSLSFVKKHCEFNSLNLLVNSVLPLVSVFMAFDRKAFYSKTCITSFLLDFSSTASVARGYYFIDHEKYSIKSQFVLPSVYWKIGMSECFLTLFFKILI